MSEKQQEPYDRDAVLAKLQAELAEFDAGNIRKMMLNPAMEELSREGGGGLSVSIGPNKRIQISGSKADIQRYDAGKLHLVEDDSLERAMEELFGEKQEIPKDAEEKDLCVVQSGFLRNGNGQAILVLLKVGRIQKSKGVLDEMEAALATVEIEGEKESEFVDQFRTARDEDDPDDFYVWDIGASDGDTYARQGGADKVIPGAKFHMTQISPAEVTEGEPAEIAIETKADCDGQITGEMDADSALEEEDQESLTSEEFAKFSALPVGRDLTARLGTEEFLYDKVPMQLSSKGMEGIMFLTRTVDGNSVTAWVIKIDKVSGSVSMRKTVNQGALDLKRFLKEYILDEEGEA
jgi:hypothetical protein